MGRGMAPVPVPLKPGTVVRFSGRLTIRTTVRTFKAGLGIPTDKPERLVQVEAAGDQVTVTIGVALRSLSTNKG